MPHSLLMPNPPPNANLERTVDAHELLLQLTAIVGQQEVYEVFLFFFSFFNLTYTFCLPGCDCALQYIIT